MLKFLSVCSDVLHWCVEMVTGWFLPCKNVLLFSFHYIIVKYPCWVLGLHCFCFCFLLFGFFLLLIKPAAFCFSRGGSTTKSWRDNARIDMKVIKDAVLMMHLHSDLYFGSFLKKLWGDISFSSYKRLISQCECSAHRRQHGARLAHKQCPYSACTAQHWSLQRHKEQMDWLWGVTEGKK